MNVTLIFPTISLGGYLYIKSNDISQLCLLSEVNSEYKMSTDFMSRP